MITKKKIEKEIVFFYYEKIDSKTIDELIDFCSKVPTNVGGKFTGGKHILLDSIKIELNNDKPSSLSLGINFSGSVIEKDIKPNLYYYFSGGEIVSKDSIEKIQFYIE